MKKLSYRLGEFFITWSDYVHFCLTVRAPSQYSDRQRMQLTFGLWHLYVNIPLWKPKTMFDGNYMDEPQYGVSFFERALWLYFNQRTYSFDMPWSWIIVRHDLLLPNGQVYWRNKYKGGRHVGGEYSWYQVLEGIKRVPGTKYDTQTEAVQYVELDHCTKGGKQQHAKIRLVGEERVWRWKWFTWFPFINITQRVVDCSSDIELGEKAGSWKGGMMGWSCEWRQGEEMKQAFNRWYREWDGT